MQHFQRLDLVKKNTICLLEIANSQEVEALVDLEPVSSIPITAVIDHFLCLCNIFNNQRAIIVEKPNSKQRKGNVQLDAEWHFLVFLKDWKKLESNLKREKLTGLEKLD